MNNQNPKDIVELAQWLMDGVLQYNIQSDSNPQWENSLAASIRLDSYMEFNRWRKKPSKQYRPWLASEVPVGVWLRAREESHERFTDPYNDKYSGTSLILSSNKYSGVGFMAHDTSLQRVDFDFALDHLEHSTDQGVTWKPCGVAI